jgi:acetyl esterase/lipase
MPPIRKQLVTLTAALLLLCQGCSHRHHPNHQNRENADTTPAITAPVTSEPQIFKDLCYVPGGDSRTQSLDLYLPPIQGHRVPLVVYIHGGGWAAGDKAQSPWDVLEKTGYACASINYRLTDVATFPAQIFDCKAAIRWLRAHANQYNFDPNKIGVWGISAGGHLAALLGTSDGVKELEGDEGNLETSSNVQAVCDWCGPANLLKFTSQAGPHQRLDADDPQGVLAKFLGGLPKDRSRVAQMADPCAYVTANDPPFLIMHGDADDIVPIGQSRELYAALQNAHVDSKMITVSGAGHEFFSADAVQQVVNFFDKHLK